LFIFKVQFAETQVYIFHYYASLNVNF